METMMQGAVAAERGLRFIAKQEVADILSKTDEILILDPEREYTAIDKSFDSEEVIQQ